MFAVLRIVLALVCLASGVATSAALDDKPVIVFAAASLKEALDQAAKDFQANGGPVLKISYAGSLTLARQLEQGAPADIFISADTASMDYAATANAIVPESRFDFLGNRLVVVAGKDSSLQSLPFTSEDFRKAIGQGRLATGEVSSVPVGKYAKAALEKLGLWSEMESHLAMAENVRAALVFVVRGEAPLGIVYATDAAAEPNVRVVAIFPANSHPPIVYPAARVASGNNPAALKFIDFLRSPAARAIFEKQGFGVLN